MGECFFWYRPTRVVPDQRPLNGSCCCCNKHICIAPSGRNFRGLFSRTTWVSRYQEGKTSLDLNKARNDRVLRCSGISWTTCKQSAPHSRQITTPTPHHSIFTGRMLFLTPNQRCQIQGRGGPQRYHKTLHILFLAYDRCKKGIRPVKN